MSSDINRTVAALLQAMVADAIAEKPVSFLIAYETYDGELTARVMPDLSVVLQGFIARLMKEHR